MIVKPLVTKPAVIVLDTVMTLVTVVTVKRVTTKRIKKTMIC